MAKYKKCKLNWKSSGSDLVMGYKLYWSKGDPLNYESNFIELGNVCEVLIPDIFKYPPPNGVSLKFGVSAVNLEGNESDIALVAETYQATVPTPPSDLSLKSPVHEEGRDEVPGNPPPSDDAEPRRNEWQKPAERPAPPHHPRPAAGKVKYYDDVGYRKLEIDS